MVAESVFLCSISLVLATDCCSCWPSSIASKRTTLFCMSHFFLVRTRFLTYDATPVITSVAKAQQAFSFISEHTMDTINSKFTSVLRKDKQNEPSDMDVFSAGCEHSVSPLKKRGKGSSVKNKKKVTWAEGVIDNNPSVQAPVMIKGAAMVDVSILCQFESYL